MTDGTRSNLWAVMREAIAVLKPRLVIWENVRGAYSAEADSDLVNQPGRVGVPGPGQPVLRALGRVLGDLSDLGFDAEWRGIRASDVGAPHGRFRVFLAAWPATDATDLGHERGRGARGRWPGSTDNSRPDATDADDAGRERTEPARRRHLPTRGATPDAASAERRGTERETVDTAVDGTTELRELNRTGTDWGPYGPAVRRWETLTRPAPPPTVTIGRNGGRRLNGRLTEWMMGLPDGWVTDVPGVSNNDALSLCGDGVVPAQAAAALRSMLNRIDVAS